MCPLPPLQNTNTQKYNLKEDSRGQLVSKTVLVFFVSGPIPHHRGSLVFLPLSLQFVFQIRYASAFKRLPQFGIRKVEGTLFHPRYAELRGIFNSLFSPFILCTMMFLFCSNEWNRNSPAGISCFMMTFWGFTSSLSFRNIFDKQQNI